MKFPSNQSGLTLVEVMLYAAVVSFVGIMVANWLNKPAQVSTMLANNDSLLPAQMAANALVSDLRTATIVDWTSIPPLGTTSSAATSFSFQQWSYNMNNPSAPPVISTITYAYHVSNGVGQLVRQVNGGTPAVALSYLDSPLPAGTTAPGSTPLAQQATTTEGGTNILMVTLLYHPPGKPLTAIVRRVYIGS